MKKPRLDCASHAVIPESSFATPPELQQTLKQLAATRRALAASEEESDVVQLQLGVFMNTISHLRHKVIRLEQELVQARDAAQHDGLTGLPNRSLLLDRLSQAIVQAVRRQRQVGLLLVDLAGLKATNDRLGRAAVDKLLLQVARRLLSCIRRADTACRYGPDAFVVLLPELENDKTAAHVARNLGDRLAGPYLVDGQNVAVSVDIGVAIYPLNEPGRQDHVNRGNIARHLAKCLDASIRSASPAKPS